MKKIKLITPTRSSADPLGPLRGRLTREGMLTADPAPYTIIPGDRYQALEAAVDVCNQTQIIHLWAGEGPTNSADDLYRAAITALSSYQLCTNKKAENRTVEILRSFGKEPNTWVVGNLMLSALPIDESWIEEKMGDKEFDLVLIHPETGEEADNSPEELIQKAEEKIESDHVIWLPANGDPGSKIITKRATEDIRLARPLFLGALKRCNRFITNSSCSYYEAPYLKEPDQIKILGKRNNPRKASASDMDRVGAVERTIAALKEITEEGAFEQLHLI